METSALGRNSVDSANETAAVGTGSGSAGAATSMNANNGIGVQTLTVSGFSGSKAVAVAVTDTAKDIAAAVNDQSGQTGVEATATSNDQNHSIQRSGYRELFSWNRRRKRYDHHHCGNYHRYGSTGYCH